jgi:hypothetical protein
MRLVMSVLFLGAILSGCSSSTGLSPTVVGKWSQVEHIPGNSVEITLTTSGSNVSGSGTWCGEAMGCGVVTVSGAVNGSVIHLDIAYSNGLIEHFDGRISVLGTLDGSATGEFPGQPPQLPHLVTFLRA